MEPGFKIFKPEDDDTTFSMSLSVILGAAWQEEEDKENSNSYVGGDKRRTIQLMWIILDDFDH